MKRPQLIHFLAIQTQYQINVRAYCSLTSSQDDTNLIADVRPSNHLRMLRKHRFIIKLICLDKQQKTVCQNLYESDRYGNFQFKIPINSNQRIYFLRVFEVSWHKDIELLLGVYMPIHILPPFKIVICDFDKTLVATTYSTAKEMYRSLTKPVDSYPTINESLDILKSYIEKDYHPFIVSASPHFYENPIRDWLYKHQIYTAGIFLKDYRMIFSLLEGILTPKDIKKQEIYKFGILLNILLMCGMPHKLALIGDNNESDVTIYLTLIALLRQDFEPYKFWKKLKSEHQFIMNRHQDVKILDQIYRLHTIIKRFRESDDNQLDISVHIREVKDKKFTIIPQALRTFEHMINYYKTTGSSDTKAQVK